MTMAQTMKMDVQQIAKECEMASSVKEETSHLPQSVLKFAETVSM